MSVAGFNSNTREKIFPIPSMSRVSVGGGTTTSIQLPKTGILAGIWLNITGTVAGTISAPNAFGMSSIISRVRLTLNSGVDIINISGPGYHYLLRDYLESEYVDPLRQTNARSAVTATTYDVSMYLPLQYNFRDPVGMLYLQSEELIATLNIDWASDTQVATGVTSITGTATPLLHLFTVPAKAENWPPFTVAHQILEEQLAVAGAGDYTYNWPRGNTYLQQVHGFGFGVSGADSWSRVRLRVQQSDYLYDLTPAQLDMVWNSVRGRARQLGVVGFDFLGHSGLGNYGLVRDTLDSNTVTDLATVLTVTGAGTFYSVRRQFVPLV